MATSEKDSSDGGDNPALGLNWQVSRWGREDQRGNGNLMNATKVLEASRLIKTGEIVSLGRRYEAGMPLAPAFQGLRTLSYSNCSFVSPTV